MKTLRRFFKRLRSPATTRQDEARLRLEIEEHLALQTDENLRAGYSPAKARRQAILKFGPVEAIRETWRDYRGLPLLESLVQETRHALRRLRMAPAFTIATVLTLALGIGATTSIFTLVNAVLLQALPVANPAELYRVGKESDCCYHAGYSQDKEFSLVSYDLYKYLRDNTRGFSELAAFSAPVPMFGVHRAGPGEVAHIDGGEFVSGNYFTMFGIAAYAGRTLSPQDDQPGAPPAAVMSYRLWEQRYGLDPSVVGGVFNLNDKPYTIVGIAPPDFFGDTLRSGPPDFYLPLNTEPYVQTDADLKKVDTHWLEIIGRIQQGANPASIEAQMRVALHQWLQSHWGEMNNNDRARLPEQTLNLSPGGLGITIMRERYQRWLEILMWVTGLVLLIVCANVASLMLVRGMERRRQTSLSMALGARTSRLVSQPLVESIVLSLFGGAAGLAIAFAGTRLILRFAFPNSAVPISPSPSMPVLLFALIASVATGIAFGIAPAWMATRVDPMEALRGSGRSTARSGSLPRQALVVFQAALALVLLSSSGLLTTALQRLQTQDFGFRQDGRFVLGINARFAGYRPEQLSQLYRRIHDSIAEVPGVSSVALCLYSPQSGGAWGATVAVLGRPAPGPRDDNSAYWERITPGYFDVIGTPLVQGRAISGQDTAATRHVAVIDEAFARKFFRNEDPIGKHFGRTPETSKEFEIVGVVKDARYLTFNLERPTDPFFFVPEAQADYTQPNMGSLYLSGIVVLAQPGAALSAASLNQAMASVDPNLPIVSIRPMNEQVAGIFTQQRFIARLTSFFGILSLVLASIGLYGVTAYNAERRTGEVGVRIALGANRSHVIWLVVRGALMLILFGLLLGAPLIFAAGRLLGNQLYGLSPYNPFVVLTSALTLGLSALIASFIPALRTSSISPVEALRAE